MKKQEVRFLLLIFLLSLTLRILRSDIPIDIDETLWMHRSLLFFKSLSEQDLSSTYLRHHPGVTNMWLSGSSVILYCLLQKLLTFVGLTPESSVIACLSTRPFPTNFYIAARFIQAVITSSCMVGIYLLGRQLLGRRIAMIGIALLVLEPFFLSYQRLITTDALQVDFMTLALLLLLLYLRNNGDRRLLLGSGIFLGLATASKIPALFALPAVAVWLVSIELGIWHNSFPQRGWKRQILDMILWGAIAMVVLFLIWPALWVTPLETLHRLILNLKVEGDGSDQLFLGKLTNSPGILFYPVVLLFRLSPVLQMGLLISGVALFIPRWRRSLSHKTELVAVAIVPISILVLLSISKTKIDRYAIPTIPELAFISAAGWQLVAVWLKQWRKKWRSQQVSTWPSMGNTVTFVFFLQLIILLPNFPYYLSYYNPLLGGGFVAQRLLMLGNGEGLDRAAFWLNQMPYAQEVSVASWYPNVFATYFQGETLKIDKPMVTTNHYWWSKAHRVVFYINQLQRQLPDLNMISYYQVQSPLYTVKLNGVEYAWVYPGPIVLPEELASITHPLEINFGEKLRLIGYELNKFQIEAGEDLLITFYWQILTSVPKDLMIFSAVSNDDGIPQYS